MKKGASPSKAEQGSPQDSREGDAGGAGRARKGAASLRLRHLDLRLQAEVSREGRHLASGRATQPRVSGASEAGLSVSGAHAHATPPSRILPGVDEPVLGASQAPHSKPGCPVLAAGSLASGQRAQGDICHTAGPLRGQFPTKPTTLAGASHPTPGP